MVLGLYIKRKRIVKSEIAMMQESDKKTIHIRITGKLWSGIQRSAKEHGQTASAEIRRVLYDNFAGENTEAET
jgi:hypothetical protein